MLSLCDHTISTFAAIPFMSDYSQTHIGHKHSTKSTGVTHVIDTICRRSEIRTLYIQMRRQAIKTNHTVLND